MIMATADLYRLAGVSSWTALVALILSGIALALFFAGAGQFWGPVNDALVVVTAIALVPAVLAVARAAEPQAAPWVSILTVAAVAGLALIAVGQTLLIVGVLSLDGSYVTGGIGVIPVIAWIVMVAALSLGGGVLPPLTGWLAVATLAAIVASSAIAALTRGPVLWVAGVVLVGVIGAWLANLATTLGGRAVVGA
jgi:hypothetical protein